MAWCLGMEEDAVLSDANGDLFAWIYFLVIHFIPEPSGFFILPYTNPGELPLLLTAFFILMVLAAKYSYMRDPRNSGKPLYFR